MAQGLRVPFLSNQDGGVPYEVMSKLIWQWTHCLDTHPKCLLGLGRRRIKHANPVYSRLHRVSCKALIRLE